MKKNISALLGLFIIIIVYVITKTPSLDLPDESVILLDGKNLSIKSLQGKPTFIIFWATTCETCIAEIPDLVEFYNQYTKNEINFLAIAMSYDPPQNVLSVSQRLNLPYPVGLDPTGIVAKRLDDTNVTPTSFLFTPEGILEKKTIGMIDFTSLNQKVKLMLNSGSL